MVVGAQHSHSWYDADLRYFQCILVSFNEPNRQRVLVSGVYYPQISICLRNLGRSALDIFHQAGKQATVNILETTIIFTAYLSAGNAGNKKLLKIPSLDNLVPRAFPLKNGWGGKRCQGLFPPHPFFKGKALGTRLVARACALMA